MKFSIALFTALAIFSTVEAKAVTHAIAKKLKGPIQVCRYLQSTDTRWVPPTEAEWSYTNTSDRSGLVNIYLHSTLDNLKKVFRRAHYTEAKPATAANNAAYVAAAILVEASGGRVSAKTRQTIRSMPVSPEKICGNIQTVAFEKDNQIFGGRHHFRVFNINRVDENGIPVWAVAAVRDSKITFSSTQPKTLFLYHAVDPDIDKERDQVITDLKNGNLIERQFTLPITTPDPTPANGVVSNDRLAIEVVLNLAPPNAPNNVRANVPNTDNLILKVR